jgi:hypothetical protein
MECQAMNSARSLGRQNRSAEKIVAASREYPEPQRKPPFGLILFCTVTPFPSNESLVRCGSTTLWSRAVPSSHGLPGERRVIENRDLVWCSRHYNFKRPARAPRRPQEHQQLSAASPRPHDSRGSRRDGGHNEPRPRAKLNYRATAPRS